MSLTPLFFFGDTAMKLIGLWLLGVPLSLILVLWLIFSVGG
jgi:hypothetical protein